MTEVHDPFLDDLEHIANGGGPNGGAPNEPDEPRSERYTDAGNARRLVALHGHQIRHVGAWGAWLVWDGRRWQRDTRHRVLELAKGVAAGMWNEVARLAGDDRTKAVKWAMQSENASRIRAMVDLAKSDPKVAIDPNDLDANRWLLNTRNGTIDLRTGARRVHDQRDLITKVAAVEHNHLAEAPLWSTFLTRILPDDEVRAFVQRWVGYCLTGDVSEHKLVFAYGVGANGKSTLFNAVARVVGDYARQAAPDLLMRHRNEPHPAGLADLQGARLVLAEETQEGRRLDESLVKRLTGGDPIKARHMYADFFEFNPTHKFVVATNHRPQIAGTDHGIWRRIRLVPFNVVIPDDQRDRHLEDKLVAQEAAGILNWAIEGCTGWLDAGLTEPTAIVSATAEYRADMDVLGEFLSDCCLLADGLQAKAADLYNTYGQWCESMGERPESQRWFGLKLREKGLASTKSGTRAWLGIGIRSLDDDSTAGRYDPNARREQAAQRLDDVGGGPW